MTINPHELLWAIINFLALMAILYKFLFKPMSKVLDNRTGEIENNLAQASQAKIDAEEMLEQYRRQLDEAQRQANDILTKASKMAEQARADIVDQARTEATNLTARAQEEIQREKDKAINELRDEVATLAVMAAGKIINKALTPEDHRRLLEEFMSEAEAGDLQ